MAKFREFSLKSGTKIFLGRDANNNDELVKKFKGKENIILHTVKPGSPFCVIENLKPTKSDLIKSAIICASKSQDWRDNKSNVEIHQFTGREVKKTVFMKTGSWKIKSKPKIIKVKKKEIEEWIKKKP